MSKTHIRMIGNMDPNSQSGTHPGAGIGGNPKTRRHYPAGMGGEWCGWRYADRALGRPGCANNPGKCGRCFTMGGAPSEYKAATKRAGKKGAKDMSASRSRGKNSKDGSAIVAILVVVLVVLAVVMALAMIGKDEKIARQQELIAALTKPVPEAQPESEPVVVWQRQIKPDHAVELGFREDGTVTYRLLRREPDPTPAVPESKKGWFSSSRKSGGKSTPEETKD